LGGGEQGFKTKAKNSLGREPKGGNKSERREGEFTFSWVLLAERFTWGKQGREPPENEEGGWKTRENYPGKQCKRASRPSRKERKKGRMKNGYRLGGGEEDKVGGEAVEIVKIGLLQA